MTVSKKVSFFFNIKIINPNLMKFQSSIKNIGKKAINSDVSKVDCISSNCQILKDISTIYFYNCKNIISINYVIL